MMRKNSAIEGIVYSVVVTPMVSARARRERWASTASGIDTTTPRTSEATVR